MYSEACQTFVSTLASLTGKCGTIAEKAKMLQPRNEKVHICNVTLLVLCLKAGGNLYTKSTGLSQSYI